MPLGWRLGGVNVKNETLEALQASNAPRLTIDKPTKLLKVRPSSRSDGGVRVEMGEFSPRFRSVVEEHAHELGAGTGSSGAHKTREGMKAPLLLLGF